jgi:toxin ParE1/3/4
VSPPRFLPEARRDFDEAFAFLEEQSPAAARRFARRIAEVIDLVAGYPDAGSLVLESTRAFPVHPFPYDLVYRTEAEGALTILAVAHHRRRPNYWQYRLD